MNEHETTMPKQRCTIMRGCPGSGKSTWAKSYRPDAGYFSADDFHIDRDTGVYEFKPENAALAHRQCLRDFVYAATKLNLVNIVVDNTNIRVWEIAPYYQLAAAHGYDVEIIHIMCDPHIAARRNTHGVPMARVLEMARSVEPVPATWTQRVIFPGWELNPENPVDTPPVAGVV